MRYIHFPKLQIIQPNFCADFAFDAVELGTIVLPCVTSCGYGFLTGVSNIRFIDIRSLVDVGTGAFSNVSGETVTVVIHPSLLSNSDYIAFKAANTITEIVAYPEGWVKPIITFVADTGDLTNISTTGYAVACEGATQFTMSLTLTTATTPPSIQLQGSDDGTNYYNIGSPLAGVANSTQQMSSTGDALPSYMHWKVSSAGDTVGTGWKITLRAK